MAFNGLGIFQVLPYPDYPAISGTLIKASMFNNTITDLVNGLSNCVTRDGQSPPTQNLPMGGRRLTGMGAGSAAGDSATIGLVETLSNKTLEDTGIVPTSTISNSISSSVTLNVPADFATIQLALASIAGKQILTPAVVTIKVADGTYTYSSVYISHPDAAKIEIIGNETTPSNCILNFSTSDGFYLPASLVCRKVNGFRLVNTTVKTSATPYLGILTDGGTFAKVGPQIEVHNFYYGIAARNGGKIFCPSVSVTNAGDVGIWAFNESYVDCTSAKVSYSDDYAANQLGGGIVAEFASCIQANFAEVHHNALCGFSSLSGSAIRAWSSYSHDNQQGAITGSGGVIELFGTPVSRLMNNTQYGAYCADGEGRFHGLNAATVTGNTAGARFSRFHLEEADGSAKVWSGSVTIEATKPGNAVGSDAYLDMNTATGHYSITRYLVSGVEAARAQYSATGAYWEMSIGGTAKARIAASGLIGYGNVTSDGGAAAGYLDTNGGTGTFAIQRWLINNAEKARFQYDAVNAVGAYSVNGLTLLRAYATGKTTIGNGAPATNATGGHLQIPHHSGAPTGAVVDASTGYSPIVYDTLNNKLWVFNGALGGWRGVNLT